jgi:hypothetical protein
MQQFLLPPSRMLQKEALVSLGYNCFAYCPYTSDENDYSILFWIYYGCLFLALLVSLKLKVTMGHRDSSDDGTGGLDMKKKKKKETRRALRQLVSPSAIIYFGLIFNGGL